MTSRSQGDSVHHTASAELTPRNQTLGPWDTHRWVIQCSEVAALSQAVRSLLCQGNYDPNMQSLDMPQGLLGLSGRHKRISHPLVSMLLVFPCMMRHRVIKELTSSLLHNPTISAERRDASKLILFSGFPPARVVTRVTTLGA